MTTKLRVFTLFFLALAGLAFAQDTMRSTTLSAAIDNTQKVFAVASATYVIAPSVAAAQGGIGSSTAANYYVLLVDAEAMKVNAVSGTTITVQRGVNGTRQTAHVSGAKVWTGPANYFGTYDPVAGTPCTSASQKVLPFVAISTGKIWDCGNSLWTTFDGSTFTVGAAITVAATIAPTNPVHHLTGATGVSVATITVPPAMPAQGGCITLIPATGTGLEVFATSGNIAVGSTPVNLKAMRVCYSPGDTKWYPSY